MTFEDILNKLKHTWTLCRYNSIVQVGHNAGSIVDYSKKENQFVVSTDNRINQLRITAKLMCIADVLNGEKDWIPEYGETAYYISADGSIIIGDTVEHINFTAFKTMAIAEEALKIMEL